MPANTQSSSTSPEKGAPSAPGVPDKLRSKQNLSVAQLSLVDDGKATPNQRAVQSSHPLDGRLAGWRATQEELKMESLNRTFGMAEPIRRGMELRIAQAGEWRPQILGGSARVHSDILSNRDCEIDWEDVFTGKLS